MRVVLLGLGLLLSACSSTPTDLLMDPPPDVPVVDPGATPGDGFAVIARGTLAGTGGHRVAGRVVVYRRADGHHLLRLEGLDAQAGPDLKVWLVQRFTGDVPNGHASLGPLQSTRGDQNYDVPIEVDPAMFLGVSIWCERFGVGFGQATLVQTNL